MIPAAISGHRPARPGDPAADVGPHRAGAGVGRRRTPPLQPPRSHIGASLAVVVHAPVNRGAQAVARVGVPLPAVTRPSVLVDVGAAVLVDVGAAVLVDVGAAVLVDVGAAVLVDVGAAVLVDVGAAVLVDVGA